MVPQPRGRAVQQVVPRVTMAWVVKNGSPRMFLRSPIVMGLVAGAPVVSLVAGVSVMVLVAGVTVVALVAGSTANLNSAKLMPRYQL